MKIVIVDYGMGNIRSIVSTLNYLNVHDIIVSDSLLDFESADRIILPGVGNFDPAIKSINENSKTKFHDFVKEDTPVLGICLGMEMFFEKSEEGIEKGFNVIDGEIVVLPSTMKVPHMGWNNLEIKKPGIILEDVADDSWVYFVHSYRAKPTFDDVITAESDYGVKVPAVVEKNVK